MKMNKLKVGDRINYKFITTIGTAVITDINYERGYCHANDDEDGFEWFLEEHNVLKISNKEIKIIQNKQTTVILWANGDKTVVKCAPPDKYDKHLGIAIATLKYQLGNRDEDGRKAYELIASSTNNDIKSKEWHEFIGGKLSILVKNREEHDKLMKIIEENTNIRWHNDLPTAYTNLFARQNKPHYIEVVCGPSTTRLVYGGSNMKSKIAKFSNIFD